MAKTEVVKINKKVEILKQHLNADTVQEQFNNTLKENAGGFVASILDLYGSNTNLQKCSPAAVIRECMKAATLKLPINKQLGLAYIVPYGNEPQFQIGYKGYIQLAMRTGQYRYLNADCVFEGIDVKRDLLTGRTIFVGEPKKNAKIAGYFCHMELLNGFTKTLYMTKREVEAWGKKYSKSYHKSSSAWKTNFDEMALKTVVRRLLSKWGIMSVEMVTALSNDIESEVKQEIQDNANRDVIDITPEPTKPQAVPESVPETPTGQPSLEVDPELEPDWQS